MTVICELGSWPPAMLGHSSRRRPHSHFVWRRSN